MNPRLSIKELGSVAGNLLDDESTTPYIPVEEEPQISRPAPPQTERTKPQMPHENLDTQELARMMLIRHSYINSRTTYPICDSYLRHLKAISKIADIPIGNVINNIFRLFFDADGALNSTHSAIKTLLLDENKTLKEYLAPTRPASKK